MMDAMVCGFVTITAVRGRGLCRYAGSWEREWVGCWILWGPDPPFFLELSSDGGYWVFFLEVCQSREGRRMSLSIGVGIS